MIMILWDWVIFSLWSKIHHYDTLLETMVQPRTPPPKTNKQTKQKQKQTNKPKQNKKTSTYRPSPAVGRHVTENLLCVSMIWIYGINSIDAFHAGIIFQNFWTINTFLSFLKITIYMVLVQKSISLIVNIKKNYKQKLNCLFTGCFITV